MSTFRSLLIAMLAAALVAVAAISLLAHSAQTQLADQANRVYVAKDVTADILPPPMYLIEMRLIASQGVEGSMPVATVRSEFERLRGEYQARVEHWTANPPYGLESTLLGEQHAAAGKFIEAMERDFLPKLTAGDAAAARAALFRAHDLYLAHRRGVDQTVTASVAFADDEIAAFAAVKSWTRNANFVAVGATVALLCTILLLIRRRIATTLGGEPEALASAAASLAAGNLTHGIATTQSGSMADSLEKMRVDLGRIIEDTRRSADEVLIAAREIELGTQDLGQRTEQQAGSLEETASAMEELNGSVRDNAQNAGKASELATGAATVAERGGTDVQRVVATMDEIQQNSKRIAEIIAVIDEIAFQTNLLALNAAVEAARAGEQGRGFAVVAGEVGALAQRSAQAAREIKGLIQTSVQNVEGGAQQVNSAGRTMAEIVARVREVSELIQDIARATQEQSIGLSNVNDSMLDVDKTTQQNAALVEQSTAAAISLRSQAAKLVEGVSQFQLDGDAPTVGTRRGARPSGVAATAPGTAEPQRAAA
ncbi:MAG: methyl-accepting chemotaxis protein [Steroidobacteraceae bacterium]